MATTGKRWATLTEEVRVRLSPEDLAHVRAGAQAARMSVSRYVRSMITTSQTRGAPLTDCGCLPDGATTTVRSHGTVEVRS